MLGWYLIRSLANCPIPDTRAIPNAIDAGFERNIFGFTKEEKADMRFFQYLRHSIMHYNGAYYAYRAIDHTYDGKRYESIGHTSEKMIVSLKAAWTILLDLEKYSLKAWIAVRGGKTPGGPTGGITGAGL